MRQLEVVAVSDDGTQVLLASAQGAAKPTHAVRIDGRLNAAVRGTLNDAARRESELSPKEIQARLRAGEAAEQVAALAKVPISRVMRYAGPVISERERIIDQARGAVLQRPRGAETTAPLGSVVEKRLAGTAGLRADTIAWTARRRTDGAWVVVLSYAARGGTRSASWLWQPSGRVLTSLNALATRLGAEDAAPAPRRKRAARTPAKRATTTRTPAKRAAASRTAAKRATPARAAAKTAAKRAASSSQAPAAKRTAAARRGAIPPAATATAPATRSKNGRVAVPSWSDVLIGVQAPAAARGVTARGAARGRRRS